ncbi:unnamed protein product, partial [marine sediment metagenome]
MRFVQALKELKAKLRNEKILYNSFFIYLSTAFGSLIGFFFWKIATMRFNPVEIGYASSFISTIQLIVIFCDVGITFTMIRFINADNDENRKIINTGFTISTITGLLIPTTFIITAKYFIPVYNTITDNIFYSIVFVIASISLLLNLFLNSLFFAKSSAKYGFF